MSTEVAALMARVTIDSASATKSLHDFDQKLADSGNKAGSAFGTIGKLAAGAFAGIGIAAAGMAVKSIASFATFDTKMREVFTLLPGISGDAMGKMTGQVKDFSKEFGVLPDKVVPALYQSISAGVPANNVFDFLTTAQKAAKGGVTELSTAVDGISSVINAYGSDTVSATQASDKMFTAVKLGKTTFSELSASLFNVVPIASSLGVNFGDVTAALAAMTVQGVPTSVATTQLRQALVEMSKAGSAASDTFKKVAGVGFKEFIAKGGNVQTALQLMEKEAARTGVGINDLFGSVEAGSAALTLTGKGTKAFGDALAEMNSSTGATDAAFNVMSQGIGASFAKMKAGAAVALLDIGALIAPFVAKFVDSIPAAIATLTGFVQGLGAALASMFGFITDGGPALGGWNDWLLVIEGTIAALTGFVQGIGAGLAQFFGIITDGGPALGGWNDWLLVIEAAINVVSGAVQSLAGWITGTLVPALASFWSSDVLPKLQSFADLMTGTVIPAIGDLASALQGPLQAAASTAFDALKAGIGFIADHKEIMGGFAIAIGVVAAAWAVYTVAQIAATAAAGLFAGVMAVITSPLLLVIAAIALLATGIILLVKNWDDITAKVPALATALEAVQTAVAAVFGFLTEQGQKVVDFFQTNWPAMAEAAGHVWDAVLAVISATWATIQGVIQGGVAVVTAIWSQFGDTITSVARIAWATIQGVVSGAVKVISGIITGIVAVINGDWSGAWESAKTIVKGATEVMQSLTEGAIKAMVAVIKGIGAAMGDLSKLLYAKGVEMVQGFIDGMGSMVKNVAEKAKGLGKAAIDGLKFWEGSPWPATIQIGTNFGRGLIEGITSTQGAAVDAGDALAAAAVTGLAAALSQTGDGAAAAYAGRVRDIDLQLLYLDRDLKAAQATTGNTAPIEKQIAFLQGWKNQLASVSQEQALLQAALDASRTAVDGFNQSFANFGVSQTLIAQTGDLGTKAMQALATSIHDNTPATGAAAFAAIQAVVDQAAKSGNPEWIALGQQAMALYAQALSDRTPEAVQAALTALGTLNASMASAATLSGATFGTAFAAAFGSGENITRIGAAGTALMAALDKAQKEGGAANIASLASLSVGMLAQIEKLPWDIRATIGPGMRAALQEVIDNPSAESLANLQTILGTTNSYLSLIPKEWEKLPPQVQAAISTLAADVDAGVTNIEDAQKRVSGIMQALPKDIANLPAFVHDAVVGIGVEMAQGTIKIEDGQQRISAIIAAIPKSMAKLPDFAREAIQGIGTAIAQGIIPLEQGKDRIAAIISAIPKDFAKLPPAVQVEIQAIVDLVRTGALGVEDGTDAMADALDHAKDRAKAAADEIKAIHAAMQENVQRYQDWYKTHGYGASPGMGGPNAPSTAVGGGDPNSPYGPGRTMTGGYAGGGAGGGSGPGNGQGGVAGVAESYGPGNAPRTADDARLDNLYWASRGGWGSQAMGGNLAPLQPIWKKGYEQGDDGSQQMPTIKNQFTVELDGHAIAAYVRGELATVVRSVF